MVGATKITEGVLEDLPTPILPKIVWEPTIESIIRFHQIISGNAAFMVSNLGRGQNVHLELTITAEDYLDHTGHVFVPMKKTR